MVAIPFLKRFFFKWDQYIILNHPPLYKSNIPLSAEEEERIALFARDSVLTTHGMINCDVVSVAIVLHLKQDSHLKMGSQL